MSVTAFSTFADLHKGTQALILPNIWDAAGALLLQQQGAPALATSSAALAWSLGYADGGTLPHVELVTAVERIMRVARVPLTVDLEDGYSDEPEQVVALVAELAEMGVVGINLEDGEKSERILAAKISALKTHIPQVFINARCDVYLRNMAQGQEAVQMAIQRGRLYQTAGADCLFLPGLAQADSLAQIHAGVNLPLNLMLLPQMDALPDLYAAGMRRLSAGAGLFKLVYGQMRIAAKEMEQGRFAAMFPQLLDFNEMNALASAHD